uniref:Uncharacterized protein n=1 Tax=Nelumbo nucifera TaxID=4432 RepID=A0A822Z2A7_NELNU|nr:TPA_asm: hypothetical protein HUJ06_008240 [Nelumbo nucifera]
MFTIGKQRILWFYCLCFFFFPFNLIFFICRNSVFCVEASAMDATEQLYRPPPEFEENTRDPLVDISLTDSTEFWLIQWPHNQVIMIFPSKSC